MASAQADDITGAMSVGGQKKARRKSGLRRAGLSSPGKLGIAGRYAANWFPRGIYAAN
jgi:hypothetical protein